MWKGLPLLALVVTTGFAATDKLVCYHGSWAHYRLGNCKYTVEDIDTTFCTHIIYGFVGINVNATIRIMDPWLDDDKPDNLGGFRRFTTRARDNRIKSLIAIGGWNEESAVFSKVVSDPNLRATFVKSIVAFLKKYGFDGFDLDWEYPAQRGGAITDKVNFSKLLAELRSAFDKEGYLLTAAVAAAEASVDQSYEVPQLSKYLDFINVMTYDLHGAWESVTGHNAPLYPLTSETGTARTLNVDACINNWIKKGADPKKLILGVGTYGRTFNVPGSNKGIGASASGGGSSGECTGEMGILGYNEICRKLAAGGWTILWNDEQQVPYAYNGNQWIGYDNERSIAIKAQYAKDRGLGGVMVWSVETDDFTGACGKKNILLSAIKTTLNLSSSGGSSGGSGDTGGSTGGSSESSTTTTTIPSPPSVPDVSPTCTTNGYVRDANDCGVFYQCVRNDSGFNLYRFVCPSGLKFDPAISACNYANLVQC